MTPSDNGRIPATLCGLWGGIDWKKWHSVMPKDTPHPQGYKLVQAVKHRRDFDRLYKYKKGESYGIPYRILTPKGIDNLLVAGRCVSSDHLVHGSIRVMPACYIMGQAAGLAAHQAAETNVSVHDIDVKKLQKSLLKIGAFLPNAKV